MTIEQKKLVLSWIAIGLILIIFGIFSATIQENWDDLRWPLLAVIGIIALYSKRKPNQDLKEGRTKLNDIVEKYPIIKLWLAIYGLAVAVGVSYVLLNGINISEKVGAVELFLLIIPLFLPIWFINQQRRYKELGSQSNK